MNCVDEVATSGSHEPVWKQHQHQPARREVDKDASHVLVPRAQQRLSMLPQEGSRHILPGCALTCQPLMLIS
ncbi:hypothetical protein WJX74_010509 [Apatococcus lobatus]|uniref:Uncharacterized protein n=2 Tax=Apatococcus TaxID=904362 RepID=A0AAW1RJX6_9CHLO